MKVLFIDFETQCTNAKITKFTEVGAALYEYQDKKWEKRLGFSHLAWDESYPAQDPFVAELTGITDEMLRTSGKPRKDLLVNGLKPLMNNADVVVAHKADFDRTVLESTAKIFEVELPKKEWLCTLTNFPWPAKYSCFKLSHLAYDHSILVDPATLHRAEDDVDLLQKLVAKYDFDEVMSYAREPFVYLWADCNRPWEDNGVQTGIAKTLGFSWEKIRYMDNFPAIPKKWVMRVKERNLSKIYAGVAKSASPFEIKKIEGL